MVLRDPLLCGPCLSTQLPIERSGLLRRSVWKHRGWVAVGALIGYRHCIIWKSGLLWSYWGAGWILATLRACFLSGKTDKFGPACTPTTLLFLFVQLVAELLALVLRIIVNEINLCPIAFSPRPFVIALLWGSWYLSPYSPRVGVC